MGKDALKAEMGWMSTQPVKGYGEWVMRTIMVAFREIRYKEEVQVPVG